MAGTQGRRAWGWIRRLPNKGRPYHASYIWPPQSGQRHNAPTTFRAKIDAEGWLSNEKRAIEQGTWVAPAVRSAAHSARLVTVSEYGQQWIEQRSLKPRTKSGYEDLLRLHITPTPLGKLPVAAVSPHAVRTPTRHRAG